MSNNLHLQQYDCSECENCQDSTLKCLQGDMGGGPGPGTSELTLCNLQSVTFSMSWAALQLSAKLLGRQSVSPSEGV